jgi:hypothetical protein
MERCKRKPFRTFFAKKKAKRLAVSGIYRKFATSMDSFENNLFTNIIFTNILN